MAFDPRTQSADPVRWFDPLGTCRGGCGKAGIGLLRGPRNESFGAYCQKCADKRLENAKKEQAAERALTDAT